VSAALGTHVRAVARTPDMAQADFRAMLAALARPGTLERITPPPAAPAAPAALAAAAGLADIEVPLCVLAAPDDEHWARALHMATSAPPADLEGARMVVALRPPSEEEVAALPRGDALHPERGARLIVAVGGLLEGADPGPGGRRPAASEEREHAPAHRALPDDGPPGGADRRGTTVIALSGPGVPGSRRIEVAGPPPAMFRALAAVNTAFPAGVDVFLVAGDGTVAGLPRSSHITIENGVH
jgi:alpha-D-ribose 1-methylphosphonate 5-triphosphate synthase subunit PhnH